MHDVALTWSSQEATVVTSFGKVPEYVVGRYNFIAESTAWSSPCHHDIAAPTGELGLNASALNLRSWMTWGAA